MVKCLITSGADINAVNNVSCTYFCFYHCNHNLLYTVQDNVTPLHYASLQGHCSIVEYLITSGADINAVNHVSCIFCFHSYIIIRFCILFRVIVLHYIMPQEKVTVQLWSI